MKLIRTFHPVGHGAFYTERFYDEHNVCKFTAVYDCGGAPVGGINRYIDKVFDPNEKINAIFVSHLHNDHISGLKYLLERCDCKKVFLPVITPNVVAESIIQNVKTAKYANNYSNQFIIGAFGDNVDREKFVFVQAVDGQRERRNEQNRRNEPQTIETASGTITSGTPLSSSSIHSWIYLPFNLNRNIQDAFFQEFGDIVPNDGSGNIDYAALIEICKDTNKLRELKDRYHRFISENPNEYSMTVYSGYNQYLRFRGCCCSDDCRVCRDCCNEYNCEICDDMMVQPGCLYMGDFQATVSNANQLMSFYDDLMCCSKTIQIPHHGSIKIDGTYNYDLYNHCKMGIFSCKFGKYPNMPANELIYKLINKNIRQVFVTDDLRLKLVKTYYVL